MLWFARICFRLFFFYFLKLLCARIALRRNSKTGRLFFLLGSFFLCWATVCGPFFNRSKISKRTPPQKIKRNECPTGPDTLEPPKVLSEPERGGFYFVPDTPRNHQNISFSILFFCFPASKWSPKDAQDNFDP